MVQTAQEQSLDAEKMAGYWRAWREQNDLAARDRLIEHYLPFARIMAGKLYRDRHSQEFEFDDYLQYATIGMIEAMERYDHNGNASFKTYATLRITGEILDGIESLSERQRQIANYKRLRAERNASLGGGTKKGNAFEQLAEIAIALALGHILDEVGSETGSEPSQPDDHYRSLEMRQMRDYLVSLVEQLPERERLVIKYNYFNHVPFDTVAQQWGVTRGRIAQLHRSALERLRQAAAELKQYDVAW